jgi:Uma2 family endonuclease
MTVSSPSNPDVGTYSPVIHRFTVQEYHRMIEAGVLTEANSVELLEGIIVSKMTHNPPHDAAVDLVHTAISSVVPKAWRVRVQSAITLPDSEPEPDIAVVRSPARRYVRSHPRPQDIALLVEVAEATLVQDQVVRARLYARHGIPIYWIVNLVESKVEVCGNPRVGRNPRFRSHKDFEIRDLVPLIIQGTTLAQIPVKDLLP